MTDDTDWGLDDRNLMIPADAQCGACDAKVSWEFEGLDNIPRVVEMTNEWLRNHKCVKAHKKIRAMKKDLHAAQYENLHLKIEIEGIREILDDIQQVVNDVV